MVKYEITFTIESDEELNKKAIEDEVINGSCNFDMMKMKSIKKVK
jgi:hypothetical protein